MAFFRTVSLSDPLPAVTGNGIVLRARLTTKPWWRK